MAGLRVELLVVVLFSMVFSVWAWELIDENQLLHFYETGQWVNPPRSTHEEKTVGKVRPTLLPSVIRLETQTVQEPEDHDGFDSEEVEEIPEDAMPEMEMEGAAATAIFDPFSDLELEVENADSSQRGSASGPSGGFEVEFVDAPPRSWTTSTSQSSTRLDVVCSESSFQITLPNDQLSEVKVLGTKDLLYVMEAPESCGYDVDVLKNTLTVPFSGCHVNHSFQTDSYTLKLLYVDEFGQTQVATASCETSPRFDTDSFPRAGDKPHNKQKCTPAPKAKNCAIPTGERVTCGQTGISSSDCEKMGCCVDSASSGCYYPLDECTGDQHFVFAIRHDSAPIPLDPNKLVIPGNANCKPVIVNDKVAIFKFKVTECGARSYVVGETKIYLAEVQTIVQALNLKFGVITRSDPLRFKVECRYGKDGTSHKSLSSVGYMVKTPSSSLPSTVTSTGLYGIQLRIAKDKTYSEYLPTYHQPLRLLLGKPVYLELNLRSPKPDAVILVNYCLAYPRSAKNALVLVYEGCANPYDPSVSILKVSDLPKNRYQRRFVVTAFQFMDQTTNKYLDEEIYFMCSSELCRPTEKTCEERCFDGKAP